MLNSYIHNLSVREASLEKDGNFSGSNERITVNQLDISFKRYILEINGFDKEDVDNKININDIIENNYKIGFSVPKEITSPLTYFIKILKATYEVAELSATKSTFYKDISFKIDIESFELFEVAEFIKKISKKTTFSLEEFSSIEDYKYLLYSTSKWLDDILNQNMENFYFFDNYQDLIDTLTEYAQKNEKKKKKIHI